MNIKKIATASVLANVLLLGYLAGKRFYYSHSAPPPQMPTAYYDNWNTGRVSVLGGLPIDSTDIVFVGNSITEGFPVSEMFHSIHFKNRGIGGNRSCHILGRIGSIAAGHPRKIFLDIGINDLMFAVPVDTLFDHYTKIIATIRAESPRTEMYIQSVFPVGKAHKELEEQVETVNTRLQAFCQEQGVVFVNIFPTLYKDGLIDPALTMDDLHLNGAGYDRWKRKIFPYLENGVQLSAKL